MENCFSYTVDLKVQLSEVVAEAHGDEVGVSYRRLDRFTDSRNSKPVVLEVFLTNILARVGGTWKIAR